MVFALGAPAVVMTARLDAMAGIEVACLLTTEPFRLRSNRGDR